MAEFKYRKKRKEFKEQTRVRNRDYREIALTKMGKRQLMLTLLSIFGVTLLSIGSTFAMFTVSSKSAEYNVVKSGTLNIDFSTSSSTIGLNGALPTSDSDGIAQTGNTFTITNTGSLTAEYTVSLQDDKDMITQDNCSDKQLDKGFIKYNIYGTNIKLLSDSIDSTIISGSLKSGESKTFTLKLWIKEDATNEVLGKHYHGKIVVDGAQQASAVRGTADELIASANSESLNYNTANLIQKNQMWTFSHETTEQTGTLTDYRYIGANPNNYIKFNDELWRIIGIFDVDDGTGKIEKRLKIIRNESIGDYSWDNKNTETGAETEYFGKNEWSDARLNYLLNPGHESETAGGSLYWNSGSGDCYDGINNATKKCDFTKTGLKDKAKAMIGDAKWYLGGSDTLEDVTPAMLYTRERGTTVYNGRSKSWVGKVGLIYQSDYGYATSGNNSMTRTSCLSKEMFNWNEINACYQNDWLFKSATVWSISLGTISSSLVFVTDNNGEANMSDAFATAYVWPVVYLKSTVKVTSGLGTKESPYILE